MSDDVEAAVDFLKFATARVLLCHTQVQAMPSSPAARDALSILRHLHTELSEAVERSCPGGQDSEVWAARYHDGRPVVSAMPLEGDGTGVYIHTWYPTLDHPANNPCELDVIVGNDGIRKQILVTAPGILDALTMPDESAVSVDRQGA